MLTRGPFRCFQCPIFQVNLHLNYEVCTYRLEKIYDQLLEQDAKGLLEDEIDRIRNVYNLHPDDDRDEVIGFIAESIFYNFYT